jgi:aminoglycoside phosphotransferase (APT) family kinase protein
MTSLKDKAKFAHVVGRMDPDSRLVGARRLPGGVSAEVTLIEVERPDGEIEEMVLRRHGPVDLQQNPNVAEDEYRLLEITGRSGLVTPKPRFLDQKCDIFPTAYVVLEYLVGETEFEPVDVIDYVSQMARHLTYIHEIDCVQQDLTFLRDQTALYAQKFESGPGHRDGATREEKTRAALEAVWPLQSNNIPVLLHGDYWPGNVLWENGKLAGIIDWEDAQFGEPLADLANARLELLWAFGEDAMDSFTDAYKSVSTIEFTNLPYWDLCTSLRHTFDIAEFASNQEEADRMSRQHDWYVDLALEAVGSTSC